MPNARTVDGPPHPEPRPHWLLLAHQLPARPSNARVKTWRRLQEIGAVPTRNSVYVLPNADQCREDFEWLRSEIVALGGEATVFVAEPVDADATSELIDTFRRLRRNDYDELRLEAERAMKASQRSRTRAAPRSLARTLRILRERFTAIERIDFFHAAARHEAEEALARMERQLERPQRVERARPAGRLNAADFQKRRWVTRPRPGVDRMSSAWLIRRFIDPAATFDFVSRPAAGDIAFDMYEGDFGHQGSLCTFEALAQRFGISTPAVTRLAQIVHDLDMKESRYGVAETVAVGRMVEGLRELYAEDGELLEHGITTFEALARSFEAGDGLPRRRMTGTTGGKTRRASKRRR